jgi:hypothetical protein
VKTYYVTKYALTQGILKVQGEVNERGTLVVKKASGSAPDYFHGKEFHTKKVEAILDAMARAQTEWKYSKTRMENMQKLYESPKWAPMPKKGK